MVIKMYYSKKINAYGKYDIAVIGGGTAGVFAAVSAAMAGKSVILIEQSGGLGGTSTQGLVTTVMGNGYGDFSTKELAEQTVIRKELVSYMPEGSYEISSTGFSFNPEEMCSAMEQLVLNNGCNVLFHTTVVDAVYTEANGRKTISGAMIYNKGGLSVVNASEFIDCSGDADFCYMAGVPFASGNDEGINQNISLRFEMAQVNIPVYEAFMEKLEKSDGGRDRFMREKFEQGYIREQDIYHFQTFPIPGKPNCLSFNCPELGRAVNVIHPDYMSVQQIEGKKAVLKLARFCCKFIPGFENAYVSKISPMLGIRESRRVDTEYCLSCADIFSFRKFSDGIAFSNYPLDAHGEKNYGLHIGTYDRSIPSNEWYYEIPLRSLIPVGTDNLLCAGRCAGMDFFVQSTTRIQHTCRMMGEAAGLAAAMALDRKKAVRDIDGRCVRKAMIDRGYRIFNHTIQEQE